MLSLQYIRDMYYSYIYCSERAGFCDTKVTVIWITKKELDIITLEQGVFHWFISVFELLHEDENNERDEHSKHCTDC